MHQTAASACSLFQGVQPFGRAGILKGAWLSAFQASRMRGLPSYNLQACVKGPRVERRKALKLDYWPVAAEGTK